MYIYTYKDTYMYTYIYEGSASLYSQVQLKAATSFHLGLSVDKWTLYANTRAGFSLSYVQDLVCAMCRI